MQAIQRIFLATYVFIAVLVLGSSSAFSQVSLSVNIAPPPLPYYAQPECPGDGYLWTPGYWAYNNEAYYWVPGAWIQPPEIGLFWTPPYWGWGGNAYAFHSGYWGSNVGYYGGINYGYGYGGRGYGGGRWQGSHFYYNQSVNNLRSGNFRHTYVDRSAISSTTRNVSYNGGKGGVEAQPTARERQFSSEQHIQATSTQRTHAQAAAQNRSAAPLNDTRVGAPVAASQKPYQSVSAKQATEQPKTQKSTFTAPWDATAKRSTGASSNGQIKAKAQTPSANQNARSTPSYEPAVKPHAEAPATHLTRSEPVVRAQSHSQAQQAKPQSQSQTHAQPQAGPDKPQAH